DGGLRRRAAHRGQLHHRGLRAGRGRAGDGRCEERAAGGLAGDVSHRGGHLRGRGPDDGALPQRGVGDRRPGGGRGFGRHHRARTGGPDRRELPRRAAGHRHRRAGVGTSDLVGWRPVFVIVLALAVLVFLFSFRLRADRGDQGIRIDLVAAVLIGVAIVLLTLGFNNLNAWGVFTATVAAPFTLVGVSPAPVLI